MSKKDIFDRLVSQSAHNVYFEKLKASQEERVQFRWANYPKKSLSHKTPPAPTTFANEAG